MKDNEVLEDVTMKLQQVDNVISDLTTEQEFESAEAVDNKDKASVENQENAPRSKAKIVKVSTVHSTTDCDNLRVTLTTENKQLKEKVRQLESENEKLRQNKSELQKKLEIKKSQYEKERTRNDELQTAVIEKSKEHNDTVEAILCSKEAMPIQENYPPIGKLRTTDNLRRVHISRNVWISERAYNAVTRASKSPMECAGSILTAVFEETTLLTSTISGYKKEKIEEDRKKSKRVECPKLDDSNMSACGDFYNYWMKEVYQPDKEAIATWQSDSLKFEYYTGQKMLN